MAKFLLIYTGGDRTEPPTEEESAAIIQGWTNWFTELGERLIDPGNPTTPAVKQISADGSVSDGPVGEAVKGYSIIAADSLEAATAAAQSCPQLKAGGAVAVYETFDIQPSV